jgi:hypothetical protein
MAALQLSTAQIIAIWNSIKARLSFLAIIQFNNRMLPTIAVLYRLDVKRTMNFMLIFVAS